MILTSTGRKHEKNTIHTYKSYYDVISKEQKSNQQQKENPNLRSLMGGRNDRNKRSSASNRPRTQIQDMTYKKYALQSKGS